MEHITTSFSAKSGRTACVIVAGGSGTRCGLDKPKQFCSLGGEAVLGHSIRFFADHPDVDQLVVVAPSPLVDETTSMMEPLSLGVPWAVVAGGARRQDSVMAGLRAVEHTQTVLVHDGARPFPPHNMSEALDRLKTANRGGDPAGIIFAIPATDSIKRVHNEHVQQTVPRADLWAIQTPQIFPTAKLQEALLQCDADGAEVTDDASAFEHMGWPVYVVMGTRSNIKITYAEDFIMAEAILQARSAAAPVKGIDFT